MPKQVVLSAACLASLLSLSACGSDSGSSASSETPSMNENSCTVARASDNMVIMTMIQKDSAYSTVTARIVGDTAYTEYETIFSDAVPDSVIQAECDENKAEAETKDGAFVTCEDRVMKINAVDETDEGIDSVYQYAVSSCDYFYELLNDTVNADISADASYEDAPISSASDGSDDVVSDPTTTSTRSCFVTENTDTTFQTLEITDSIVTMTTLSYTRDAVPGSSNGTFQEVLEIQYASSVTDEYLEKCSAWMASAAESSNTTVSCENNTFEKTYTQDSVSKDLFTITKANLMAFCDQ